MSITQLQVVSVPVRDQEKAKAFYLEMLGFRLVADEPMAPEQRWVQVQPPGGQTSVTLVTWFETMPPGAVKGLVLGCDDIQATYDELHGRGVQFDGPVTKEFWGTYATFEDPDGNGWVLMEDPS